MQLVDRRGTNLSQQETADLWSMIDESRRRDKAFYHQMRRLRSLLKRGITDPKKLGTSDKMKVVINLAHAYVHNMAPTLFFQDPVYRCLPTHPKYEGQERTWSQVLNNTIRKVGFKKELDKVILDAVFQPEAWMKWVLNTVEAPTSEHGYSGLLNWLSLDTPVPVRIPATQVIVDYASPDRSLEGARFVDIVYWRSLSELKLDKRYKIPKDIEPPALDQSYRGSEMRNDPYVIHDPQEFRQGFKKDDEFVLVHEVIIYQIVDLRLYKQVVYLLEGTNGLLSEVPIRKIETWEDLFGEFNVATYPITRLTLFPVPDSLPSSGLGIWSSLQDAINWIATRITNFIDIEKQLIELDINKVKDPAKARRAINGGKSREIIDVNELGAINMVQNHIPTRTHDKLLDVAQYYADQVSGVAENKRGASGIRTATEASLIDRGQRIRINKAVDRVRDFMVDNGYILSRMIRSIVVSQQSVEWVLRVGGDTGSVEWLTFDAQSIDWIPEIYIEADSFRQAEKQQKMQEALIALDRGTQIFQLTGGAVRIDMLFKKLLEIMEYEDIGLVLGSDQDQMMLQSSEMVLLAVGQEVPINEDDNHVVHSQTIQKLMNSPEWSLILQSNPQAANAVLQHKAAHDQKIQEAQQAIRPSLGQNPFDDILGAQGQEAQSATPANLARQATRKDRTVVTSIPGTGGQLEV